MSSVPVAINTGMRISRSWLATPLRCHASTPLPDGSATQQIIARAPQISNIASRHEKCQSTTTRVCAARIYQAPST